MSLEDPLDKWRAAAAATIAKAHARHGEAAFYARHLDANVVGGDTHGERCHPEACCAPSDHVLATQQHTVGSAAACAAPPSTDVALNLKFTTLSFLRFLSAEFW